MRAPHTPPAAPPRPTFVRAGLVAALASSACSGPVPVFLRTSDAAEGPVTDPSPEVRDVLDEGFGTWGLAWELVGPGTVARSYGAIDLTIVELAPGAVSDGSTTKPALCRVSIWSSMNGLGLGHELGHAWGLEHVEDEANLMHARPHADAVITDAQLDDADRAIGRFLACADGT